MRLKTIAAALLCSTACLHPSQARAEPISTAIGLTALIAGGIGVSATTAGVIGGVVVSGAISVGANLISNSLKSNPNDTTGQNTAAGVQEEPTVGAVTPLKRVYGKQAVAGNLVFWQRHGPNSVLLTLVYTLATGPHDLFGVIDDGKDGQLEHIADNLYAIRSRIYAGTGGYTATLRFYNGFYDQEADPDLIEIADPTHPWSSNHRGRGVCYVALTLIDIPEVYEQGIPKSLQFIIGARLYDRRKDDTAGGVGVHRWTDQHTWEWSDNPALGLYEYERGYTLNGIVLIGRGLAPVDLLSDYFDGAAAICEEEVDRGGGETEPRYRVGMTVGADMDFVQVERDFCLSMTANLIETVGAYGPLAGVAQPIAMTFTDRDLLHGREVLWSAKRTRAELVNAVYGAFTDTTQNYQPLSYAPRFSLDDESADGGRFALQRDVLMIQSETQAQRVIEILRRSERLQGVATVTLGFKYSVLEAGDWVRWISDFHGFDKVFRISHYSLDRGRAITLNLRETSSDVYGDATLLDPLNPVSLPGYGALINTVPDFAVTARQIAGAGGLTIPALHCEWTPIHDHTVDAVIVQYRVGTDDATIKQAPPLVSPADGEGNITDGVQAATNYQARAIIATTPPRTVEWTAWKPVLSPSNHIVPQALTADAADQVPAAGILGQIIAAQIADAAITSAKIAAAAVTATAFAAGIEPVSVVASLPSAGGYTGPKTVFNTTDGKLYRYASGAFTVAVPTTDLAGTIIAAQIAAAAIDATKFAAGIEPVSVVASLPSPSGYTGPKTLLNTTDGKLYRYASGAFTVAVPAVDLTGQVATAQIADAAIISTKLAAAAVTAAAIATAAIDATKFAAGIEPVSIVTSLPSPSGYSGPKSVFSTGDGKLYRYAAGAFTAAVPTTDLTGQITTTQITDTSVTTIKVAANAITTAKLAAGAVTANEIAANTITAGQIAAAAISTGQLAAGAVTTPILAAGAVTAAKLAVGSGAGNMIYNADFIAGIVGVTTFFNTTGITPSIALYSGTSWAPLGMNACWFSFAGTPAAATVGLFQFNLPKPNGSIQGYPVTAGKRYEYSLYLSVHRHSASALLNFYDTSGNNLGDNLGNSIDGGSTGVTAPAMDAFPRSSLFVTAPVGAAYAVPGVKMLFAGGLATPDLYAAGLYFAEANANQTELTPWSPSGATVISGGQIITDSITATQIAASAVTTAKLAAGAVTANEIAANTITAAKIAANTITAGQIAAGAISTGQLAAGAVTTPILAAGAVTTDKLAVGSGAGNMLFNSDFIAGVPGVECWYNLTGLTPIIAHYTGTDWAPRGMNAALLGFGSTPAGGTLALWKFPQQKVAGTSQGYPVTAGKRYEYSAYLAVHWHTARVLLNFLDKDGNIVGGDFPGNAISGGTTVPTEGLSGYPRSSVFATAPAGAAYAMPSVWMDTFGGSAPSIYVSGLYLAEANTNQTTLTPWSPSGATVISGGQIITDSITATQIAANAISASELAANAVTAGKVQAGAISTTQLAAGGVTTGILAAGAVTTAILAAQAVDASKVVTSNLVTLSAQIANLIVQDVHIVGASVAVADATVVGVNNGNGGWQTTNTMTLSFTNTINNSKIPVFVGGSVVIHKTSGVTFEVDITLNSNRIWYDYETNNVDRVTYFQGGYYVTGNGGTVSAVLNLNYSAVTLSFLTPGGVLNAAGFKR